MIVKFFRRGRGKARAPVQYLLGKNQDRAHARLLSGDIEEISQLIDSSPYQKTYTSGCLSFFECDLDPKLKQQIMHDFEQCLFPEMDPSQYRLLWVEHRDKINPETQQARLELNFLIANVEISTGKRLQPYYHAADLARVDCFKKITNHLYRLHDPDHPDHQLAVRDHTKLPHKNQDFVVCLNRLTQDAAEQGNIHDRSSLLAWLDAMQLKVTRLTKKQISIENPATGKACVFKGSLYEQNFRIDQKSAAHQRRAAKTYRIKAYRRHQRSLCRYRQLCAGKSEQLKKHYQRTDERSSLAIDRDHSNLHTTAENGHRREISSPTAQSRPKLRANESIHPKTDQPITSQLAACTAISTQHRTVQATQEQSLLDAGLLDFDLFYLAHQQSLLRPTNPKKSKRRPTATAPIPTDAATDLQPEPITATQNHLLPRRTEQATSVHQNARPPIPNTGGILDESRSTTVAHHRATTARITQRFADLTAQLQQDRTTDQTYRRPDDTLRAFPKDQRTTGGDNTGDQPTTQKIADSRILGHILTAFRSKLQSHLTDLLRTVGSTVQHWLHRQLDPTTTQPTPTASRPTASRPADPNAAERITTGTQTYSRFSQYPIELDCDALQQVLEQRLNPQPQHATLESKPASPQPKLDPAKNNNHVDSYDSPSF